MFIPELTASMCVKWSTSQLWFLCSLKVKFYYCLFYCKKILVFIIHGVDLCPVSSFQGHWEGPAPRRPPPSIAGPAHPRGHAPRSPGLHAPVSLCPAPAPHAPAPRRGPAAVPPAVPPGAAPCRQLQRASPVYNPAPRQRGCPLGAPWDSAPHKQRNPPLPSAPFLSKEEFYRQQRRLKEE